ncbi:alpha/beta hydrolase family protein [Sphingomonas crusticola]|uniref:alpha/beta hydrolase family protein n=1 Tax=Sphingomonas crusticola TaxID=1697973 RepID=UPI000E27E3CD|nr:alpha/beta fold hydrolase [Sphingomonas crusticola]
MLGRLFVIGASFAMAAPVMAQSAANPIVADMPRDAAHPARLEQVRYPTGGVQVPARLFIAAGAGPHPTVLLLHGFPGTELNLDLARVLQRSGWNVLAIHYRGMWGSPGPFSFGNTIEDAHAAIAWLRSPAAAEFGVDTKRIVVVGHSMGGFDAAMLGDDAQLAGYVLISPADVTKLFSAPVTQKARAGFAQSAVSINATLDSVTADVRTHGAQWDWAKRAGQMKGRPVLVLTSDDGLAPVGEAAAQAASAAGGPKAMIVHMTTDHSFNDQRVALATTVLDWLMRNFARP